MIPEPGKETPGPGRGTGTIQNVLITQARKGQSKAEEGSEQGTEFWPPLYGYRLKVTDTLLVGITFLLFLATFALWLATRRLVRGADKTAERQLRSYVFFEHGTVKLITTDKGRQFLVAEIQFKNFGQTPAYKVVSCMAIDVRYTSSPPFDEKAKGGAEYVIGPGGSSVLNLRKGPIGTSDIDDIRSCAKTIFIWGRTDYVDAFKTPRHFIFYMQNGIELPGIGWQIKNSDRPNEAN